MWSEVDVVCFAPTAQLECFGDASDDAQIDSAIVDQFILHDVLEFPLSGILLAHSDGNRRRTSDSFQASGILTADGIFHEEGMIRFQSSTELNCMGSIQPSMHVDEHVDVWSNRLSDCGELFNPHLDRAIGVE